MVHLDLSDKDQACEIKVDHTVGLNSVLLIHRDITIRIDGHQAFILMKNLADLFNCDVTENEYA
ncbi:hypothetical protein BG910_09530 [Neisseria chenwenguii]|uniref:Uncharacterized protein n=1 Tax=Neisseria chenwenguii TaxID=1853278 RepID=A0A220S3G7_9NEIS|nr:hypothetical protein BG910_09530 [Neisseria chenwenguii]ATD64845.1 hypothetical protein CGZ65_05135 [Neisseria weixii]ATD65355.1 hypothetical protein CGZ65_08745 [Neisseria weixii]ROV54480.1 hypothetical protein EGS38_10950 [Neisseria chenwenguii]